MGKSKREEEYSILITCCDIICTVEFLQQDFSIKFPDIVAYNVCKILCNCAIVFFVQPPVGRLINMIYDKSTCILKY